MSGKSRGESTNPVNDQDQEKGNYLKSPSTTLLLTTKANKINQLKKQRRKKEYKLCKNPEFIEKSRCLKYENAAKKKNYAKKTRASKLCN